MARHAHEASIGAHPSAAAQAQPDEGDPTAQPTNHGGSHGFTHDVGFAEGDGAPIKSPVTLETIETLNTAQADAAGLLLGAVSTLLRALLSLVRRGGTA